MTKVSSITLSFLQRVSVGFELANQNLVSFVLQPLLKRRIKYNLIPLTSAIEYLRR